MTDSVQLVNGRNVWLLSRTGRDGADRDAVVASAGLIMAEWLRAPSPTGLRGIYQVKHASAEGALLHVGGARPLKLYAERARLDMPLGKSLVKRGGVISRMVNGPEPWSVLADFEWCGLPVSLPWPFHQAAVLGSSSLSDLQLDWLLVDAVSPLPSLSAGGVA